MGYKTEDFIQKGSEVALRQAAWRLYGAAVLQDLLAKELRIVAS